MLAVYVVPVVADADAAQIRLAMERLMAAVGDHPFQLRAATSFDAENRRHLHTFTALVDEPPQTPWLILTS